MHATIRLEKQISLGLVVLILLLSAWLFWQKTLQVPPGLEMDELIELEIAEQIQSGDLGLFYSEGQGREPLYHYWLALLVKLLGKQLLTLRLASTLISILGVAATYRFIRSVLGAEIATLSTLIGITTFWYIFAARSGLRSTSLPLFASLSGIFMWRGLHSSDKRRSMLFLAGGGFWIGLAFYTYTSARVLPLIYLAFILYLALFHRQMLRPRLPGIFIGTIIAGLMLLPLLLFLKANPGADEFAFMDFNKPVVALQAGDPLPAVTTTLQTLGMFTIRGDPLIFDNIPNRPVFGIAIGLLFYIGLLLALWRWRRAAMALAIIWLGIGLVPGMLSQPAPNYYRTVLAQIVVSVFPAIALVALSTLAARQLRKPKIAFRIALIIGLILAAQQAVRSWQDYFQGWPEVEGIHFFWQESLADSAAFLNDRTGIQRAAVCTALVNEQDAWWRPAWKSLPYFSQRDDMHVAFYDCRRSLILPGEATYYIYPDDIPPSLVPEYMADALSQAELLPSALPESSGVVLFHPLETEENYLSRNPVRFGPIEADAHVQLPVRFGEYMQLESYEYLQDQNNPGGQLQILTQWRLLTRPPSQLALFTHIMDESQNIVTQQDDLPVSLLSLQPDDRFWVLHDQLWMPADSGPATYLAAIGIYDPETMERVQIIEDGENLGDRLFLESIHVE